MYNYAKFNNQVFGCQPNFKIVDLGFPDHHNPPLELLFEIILQLGDFLEEDHKNVAVIHCKVRILQI
jgi:hypothetical protein